MQRVAKKVNPHDSEGRDVFISIGQAILKASSANDVVMLFEALKGEKSVIDIKSLLPSSFNIPENYNRKEWQRAATWVEWWTRKRHLSKLCMKIEILFKCIYQNKWGWFSPQDSYPVMIVHCFTSLGNI